MNFRNYFTLLTATTLILLTSCAKDNDYLDTSIIGTWTWVSSSGGFAGDTTTPESENINRQLVFDDFYVTTYENSIVVDKRQFDILLAPVFTPSNKDSIEIIRYENGIDQFITIGKDKLELRERCDDCYFHTYER